MRITNYECCIHKLQMYTFPIVKYQTIIYLQVYEERYTFQEKEITNLDLQGYNCKVTMLELS